jgi:hypothetical protein
MNLRSSAKIGFAPFGHEHVGTSDKRQALVDLGKRLGMCAERSVSGQTVKIDPLRQAVDRG